MQPGQDRAESRCRGRRVRCAHEVHHDDGPRTGSLEDVAGHHGRVRLAGVARDHVPLDRGLAERCDEAHIGGRVAAAGEAEVVRSAADQAGEHVGRVRHLAALIGLRAHQGQPVARRLPAGVVVAVVLDLEQRTSG